MIKDKMYLTEIEIGNFSKGIVETQQNMILSIIDRFIEMVNQNNPINDKGKGPHDNLLRALKIYYKTHERIKEDRHIDHIKDLDIYYGQMIGALDYLQNKLEYVVRHIDNGKSHMVEKFTIDENIYKSGSISLEDAEQKIIDHINTINAIKFNKMTESLEYIKEDILAELILERYVTKYLVNNYENIDTDSVFVDSMYNLLTNWKYN